jgi:hypothetical protein
VNDPIADAPATKPAGALMQVVMAELFCGSDVGSAKWASTASIPANWIGFGVRSCTDTLDDPPPAETNRMLAVDPSTPFAASRAWIMTQSTTVLFPLDDGRKQNAPGCAAPSPSSSSVTASRVSPVSEMGIVASRSHAATFAALSPI